MLYPNLYGLNDELDKELDKVHHVTAYAMSTILLLIIMFYIGTTLS